ncbi:hypothetical protein yc1106_09664 [Curvularia clavata]|uniref:Uncharacterized protein n=1 Tax=Curvularia clavata TaxID=95742 RepID=A0A9Q9DXW2_CURCL|nr:hypothetical protein yc1106_09664 [Curvularia clavata]
MAEASDSVRIGKRPRRDAQPDLAQDVPLEGRYLGDSSNSQRNSEERPSVTRRPSTPTTRTHASTLEDGPSYHLADSLLIPWEVNVSSDDVSLGRQLIEETDCPSPGLQNLDTSRRDQHNSESQPDSPRGIYTFDDDVINELNKLLKMEIDYNVLFPPSSDEEIEDLNTRMVLAENEAQKGADVNAQDGQHGSASQRSSFSGHEAGVKLLLERDAEMNENGESSTTSLHFAAANNNQKIVERPLAMNDPNTRSSRGQKELESVSYFTSIEGSSRSPDSTISTAAENMQKDIWGDIDANIIILIILDTRRKHYEKDHSELFYLGNLVDEVPMNTTTPPEMDILFRPPSLRQVSNNERTSLTNANSFKGGDAEIDQLYPETIPVSPSYASSVASVFSVGSLASSATDLSHSSGYSTVQIASATKVLLSVFQEDTSFLRLYENAMNNPHIGPDRLRRNLRRMFKAYSKQLESEAKERLEFLTSRLVMMKSGLLADSIVEKLQTAQVTHLASNVEHKDESSEEDGDESSGAYPVNEEAFEDLEVFREFLVKSEAFQNLHMQVQVFVTGKSTQTVDANTMENEKLPSKDALQQCYIMSAAQARMSLTWENWIEDVKQTIDGLFRDTSITKTTNSLMLLFTDAFMLATDGILITLGQLEPALKPGLTRLRWRCSCGDHLYSDVLELRAGGISELTGHMQRTSGVKVHVSSYDQQNSVQQYIAPHPVQSIQNAGRKICAAMSRATQLSTLLPQYNTQCHANASTTSSNNASCTSNCNTSSTSNSNASSISSGNASSTPNNNAPQQNTPRLLSCMHRDRGYVGLIQDPLENVTTDRTLLCFLRRQYVCHRGSILRMVSLKSIKGLHLVKFWLTKGGKVIVGHHERYCAAASSASMLCECLPPVSKVEPSPGAEYRCRPVPPKTTPPIPPEWLSGLITCPTDMDEDDTFILNQLPKRTCGKLQGQTGEAIEGWGVYYQEDWDHDMIMWAALILLIVASLLFGILWSRFKLDIQGAFGVSSWITAVCAIFLVVVANHADKKR